MQLYKVGEVLLKKVENREGSLKNLVFASKYNNPKQMYALLCKTLKYHKVLEEIIDQTQLLKQMKGLSKQLVSLLLHDFLFGKGIQCSGKLKQIIVSRKSMLHSALARIKIKRQVVKNEELISNSLVAVPPKYVRVNTLKTSTKEVEQHLIDEGYTIVGQTSKEKLALGKKEFAVDEYIKNLLIFNHQTDFHDHPLYIQGKLLFQDRSSCIPSEILHPPRGSHVIDACAAPGNKTSHLAALMENSGKIFAFDLNKGRFATMKRMLSKAGVANCEVKQCDFLRVLPSDPKYAQVTHILLDPSCSGSGMVNRMGHVTDNDESSSSQRLEALSHFQSAVLNHALSFSKVRYVTYSTCSIHEMENERVVKEALKKNPHFSLKSCLTDWKRRGMAGEDEGLSFVDAQKCVRCNPESDHCNGFFVALLQRNLPCAKRSASPTRSTFKTHKKRKLLKSA